MIDEQELKIKKTAFYFFKKNLKEFEKFYPNFDENKDKDFLIAFNAIILLDNSYKNYFKDNSLFSFYLFKMFVFNLEEEMQNKSLKNHKFATYFNESLIILLEKYNFVNEIERFKKAMACGFNVDKFVYDIEIFYKRFIDKKHKDDDELFYNYNEYYKEVFLPK